MPNSSLKAQKFALRDVLATAQKGFLYSRIFVSKVRFAVTKDFYANSTAAFN
jgi:hypothetical protein